MGVDTGMVHMMAALDSELNATMVKSGDDNMDLDVTLVENLLASFAEQHGFPGPASTLLAELQQSKRD